MFKIVGLQNLFQPDIYFLDVDLKRAHSWSFIFKLILKQGSLLISDMRRGPLKEGEDI
jgi:hypothetical protein